MPTFTSRLGLQMDADTENYDVDVVNGNSLKIDANIGVVMCTSATRPSVRGAMAIQMYLSMASASTRPWL